tara:strand:- start:215 stop:823 length:609 start_codon:yes stop_codon:yes gene_type:complete
MQKGVNAVFQTPMAYYLNKELISDLKKYIISKETQGIESNCAPNIKHNLVESKFDFLYDDEPIVKEIKEWFQACLKKTINIIQMQKNDYSVTFNESWYHITKTNGMHEPHIHPSCSWCGIYYIQSGDEGSGETVFGNPVRSTYIDYGNQYLNNLSTVRIKPQDGKLVLFPSYLNHYQALYKGDEDRIVVAFNSTIKKLEEEN